MKKFELPNWLKNERIQNLLILTALVLWSFWIYRLGVVAFPRQDHFSFMFDRATVSSDWDYFWHSVSFNKTRTTFQGDYYLFRPVFLGTLGLIDIFFRHNLYVIGAISIIWHAAASFLLYLFVAQFAGKKIALLLSVVFSTQYPGLEMVIWRHVSLYMLALIFFVWGLFLISKLESVKNPKKTVTYAVILFFISSLIFETMAFVLVVSLPIIFVVRKQFRESKKEAEWKVLLKACSFAILAYGYLYMIDYFVRKPPTFLGPSDVHGDPTGIPFVLFNICYISGLISAAFFLPNLVKIFYPSAMHRAWWSFSETGSDFLYCWLGAFLVLMLIVTFILGIAYLIGKKEKWTAIIYWMAFAYLGVVVAGLTVGRVSLRSINYMLNSTYYYYMTNYLLALIGALLIYLFKDNLRISSRTRNILWFLFILFSVHQVSFGYGKIQEALAPRNGFDEKIAEATLEVATKIRENQSFCYGGSMDPVLSEYLLNDLLYREMCRRSEKTRLYAVSMNKDFWLSKLDPINSKKVDLDLEKGNFINNQGFLYSKNLSNALTEGKGIVLSKESYDLEYLSVMVHYIFDGGIVLGYRNPKNFMLLVLKDDTIRLHLVQEGNLTEPILSQKVKLSDMFEISIRRVGIDYVIFYNQDVLTVLLGGFKINGKVGLYDFQSGPNRQAFSEFKISEADPSRSNFKDVLKPVLKLNLPRLKQDLSSNEGWAMASNQPI